MNHEPAGTDSLPLHGEAPQIPQGFFSVEEIRGPMFGFHVAAYTIERAEGIYAFAKICRERPESVWETPDARAILSAGPAADAESALASVFESVYKRLRVQRPNLPTLPTDLQLPQGPDEKQG